MNPTESLLASPPGRRAGQLQAHVGATGGPWELSMPLAFKTAVRSTEFAKKKAGEKFILQNFNPQTGSEIGTCPSSGNVTRETTPAVCSGPREDKGAASLGGMHMHTLGHTDTHTGAHTQTHTRACTLRPDKCVSERRRLPAAWGNKPSATCTRHPQGQHQVTPRFHTHPLFFAGGGVPLPLERHL